jgi:hypothetical protein
MTRFLLYTFFLNELVVRDNKHGNNILEPNPEALKNMALRKRHSCNAVDRSTNFSNYPRIFLILFVRSASFLVSFYYNIN